LSTWLRDYLFLPVSYALSRKLDGVRWLGLRDEVWIYCGATMATMLLGGLWHGAAWNFVLWGGYQGLLLVTFRVVAMLRGRRRRKARVDTLGSRLAGHSR
jgi:D-alanyl-lipoteichoic acid acyltransferase DltB (MBOAT superfamily)